MVYERGKHMNTKVIVDKDDKGYAETIYLSQDPRVKKDILEGMATPIEDCISEDEVTGLFEE